MKYLVLLLVALLTANANAYQIATPAQYSGLQWNVGGTTGFEPNNRCTSLTLNGITDFANNSIVNFSGTLNCNSGATAFVVSGTGYINISGGLTLGLTVANGYFWNCETNASFFANCKVVKSVTEQLIANPTITFR